MRKKKNIKLRVKNLIEKYGTSNPYRLCEKLNINIVFRDLGEIKGYFKKVLRNKYIVINENLDEYSQKVVLCHELDHALYHSSKKVLFMIYYTHELENEANQFAAELMAQQYDVVSYEIAENCDLGLNVLEEMRKYIIK